MHAHYVGNDGKTSHSRMAGMAAGWRHRHIGTKRVRYDGAPAASVASYVASY